VQTAPSRTSSSNLSPRATLRTLAVAIALPFLFAGAIAACSVTDLPNCFKQVREDLSAVLNSTGATLGRDVTSIKTFTTSNTSVMGSMQSALGLVNQLGRDGTFSVSILQRIQDNQNLLAFLAQNHDPGYQHFLGASCPDSTCVDFQAALVDLLNAFADATNEAGQLVIAEAAAFGGAPIELSTARDVNPVAEIVQSAPPALLFPLWKALESVDVGSTPAPGCGQDNAPCTVVRQIADLLARVAADLPQLTQLYQQAALLVREKDLGRDLVDLPYDPASSLCGALLSFGPPNISIVTAVVNAVGLLAAAIGAELIANQYFLSLTRANVGASVGLEGTAGLTFDPGKYLGWIGQGIKTMFSVSASISSKVESCRTLANQQLILCMLRGDGYDVCYDDVLNQTAGRVPGF